MDWNKRKEEITNTINRYFIHKLPVAVTDVFSDEIISQEQSILSKLEADKAELLKIFDAIIDDYEFGYNLEMIVNKIKNKSYYGLI